MNQGLRLRNEARELTISTDAQGLVCIGKMTAYGGVMQDIGSPTSDYPGKVAGYSKYRISFPTPILVAIDLPLGFRVSIISVVQVSPGVWEATCHCSGSDADAYGFSTQYPIDCWAYAVSSRYGVQGMLLRNPATGAIAYDLSQPYPLFPRGSGTHTGTTQAIVLLSRPVVLGVPLDDPSYHSRLTGQNQYKFQSLRGAWMRRDSATLDTMLVTTRYYQYFATEPRDGSDGDIYNNASYFLIEGALLP